jgi:hypothetical protein
MHHRASLYLQALTTHELKVKPKSLNIAGLQLADLLAHPAKQQALMDWGLTAIPPKWPGSFGEKIASTLAPKFNKELWKGTVEGYGRILFPK